MSDISTAMTDLLLSVQAITDLVGTRVYSDRLPQNSTPPQTPMPKPGPAIVQWIISEIANDALDEPIYFDGARVQVNCYAQTRLKANELRLTVRQAICPFYGTVGETIIKGIGQLGGLVAETDRALAGTDQYRFVARQDFRVYYCSYLEIT